ncbi:peptide/nickel transport system permease protein [Bradyrhizobium daqingense]|uniref:Peptide/nickel transport system permease protein n=1 Tax=Bradyrhizobium daqingense TaxID=993502 RepID=A0A562KZG6_9BRAD|nr:peptide/nickel transport system permease protein [Bradyrhizobium daqingense]
MQSDGGPRTAPVGFARLDASFWVRLFAGAPHACRILRLRNREFVEAALCQGEGTLRIVLGHILPNAISPILVVTSLTVATAILLESALSFMGLGDPNLMSWGFMIGAGRTVIRNAWWMSVFPGFAILITVLAINLFGEGLSDVLNPRVSRRRS